MDSGLSSFYCGDFWLPYRIPCQFSMQSFLPNILCRKCKWKVGLPHQPNIILCKFFLSLQIPLPSIVICITKPPWPYFFQVSVERWRKLQYIGDNIGCYIDSKVCISLFMIGGCTHIKQIAVGAQARSISISFSMCMVGMISNSWISEHFVRWQG